jgi:hypothetical protein
MQKYEGQLTNPVNDELGAVSLPQTFMNHAAGA